MTAPRRKWPRVFLVVPEHLEFDVLVWLGERGMVSGKDFMVTNASNIPREAREKALDVLREMRIPPGKPGFVPPHVSADIYWPLGSTWRAFVFDTDENGRRMSRGKAVTLYHEMIRGVSREGIVPAAVLAEVPG